MGCFLLGEIESVSSAISEGIVYLFYFYLCSFLAEVLVKVIGNKREKKLMSFAWYYVITSAINIVLILVLTFLWMGKYKGSIGIQVLVAIVATAFSFYMYCISQMEKHETLVGQYDDCEYLKNEKARMNQTEIAADKLLTIDGEDRRNRNMIIKLHMIEMNSNLLELFTLVK